MNNLNYGEIQERFNSIISYYDNIDVNDISTSIHKNITIFSALKEINETNKPFSYYPQQLSCGQDVIQRNGSIVIGYYCRKNVTFKLEHGSYYSETISIDACDFRYAVQNECPFLLVCVDYIDTKIYMIEGDISDIYVIYGLLGHDDKLFLCCMNRGVIFDFTDDKTLIYYKWFIYEFYDRDSDIVPIVKMKPLYQYHMSGKNKILESKKRLDVILKELMERTWHPSRFVNWCLPYDEQNIFETIIPITQ